MNVRHRLNSAKDAAPGLRSSWLGLLLVLALTLFAVPSQATTADFVSVNSYLDPEIGNSYGIKGVPSPGNHPAGRAGSSYWKTPDGMFWMYGGSGYTPGPKSDLWKYDPAADLWTWVAGDTGTDEKPVYGSKGVSSPSNSPGSRSGAYTWTAKDGTLWLFGGDGDTNELWKFDPTTLQWTWMSGSVTPGQYGNYGIKGVGTPDNSPAIRGGAATWTGNDGSFWLFAGFGKGATQPGELNDLWRYDVQSGEWTWVSGSNDPPNNFFSDDRGTKGVAASSNMPLPRENAVTWTDSDGKLWLFGGNYVTFYFTTYYGNEMWQFDPSSGLWTWFGGDFSVGGQPGHYETQGEYAPDNIAGTNENVITWTDADGRLRLFGGDLWIFDPVLKQWAWIKGSADSAADYGVKGQPSENNTPGAKVGSATWLGNDGHLWLFGGRPVSTDYLSNGLVNAFWEFDPTSNQWTWISGSTIPAGTGVYGARGVAAIGNTPGNRLASASWTDSNGKFWLFGGGINTTNGPAEYNDLWMFDPAVKLWTWIGGSQTTEQAGIYGTKGVFAPDNIPGARGGAATWTGQDGSFWLFGGSGGPGLHNDLWKFDPASRQWAWIAGSNLVNQSGIYGTQGSPASGNVPGGRSGAVTWFGSDGNLWLYGGKGYANSSTTGTIKLGDLWKFDLINHQWTWVNGLDRTIMYLPYGFPGIYGTKGVPDPSNIPGSRSGAASWIGTDGVLWMFGGASVNGALNDLWKYDPDSGEWTWMTGDDSGLLFGTNEVTGVYAPENTPSAMAGPLSWTGKDGAFWLLGGGDLWKFNPSVGQWAWIKGNDPTSTASVSGGDSNVPLDTSGGASWVDESGNFWFFAGNPNLQLWEIRMRFTSAVDDWQKLWGAMD